MRWYFRVKKWVGRENTVVRVLVMKIKWDMLSVIIIFHQQQWFLNYNGNLLTSHLVHAYRRQPRGRRNLGHSSVTFSLSLRSSTLNFACHRTFWTLSWLAEGRIWTVCGKEEKEDKKVQQKNEKMFKKHAIRVRSYLPAFDLRRQSSKNFTDISYFNSNTQR